MNKIKRTCKWALVLLLCFSLEFPVMANEITDVSVSSQSEESEITPDFEKQITSDEEIPSTTESTNKQEALQIKSETPIESDLPIQSEMAAESRTETEVTTEIETESAENIETEILTQTETDTETPPLTSETELIENLANITVILKNTDSSASKEISIQWEAVKEFDIDGYIVYRKTANSDWVRMGTTILPEYKDTSTADYQEYYYTVRAYKFINEKCYLSAYDKKGILGVSRAEIPPNVIINQLTNTTVTLKNAKCTSFGKIDVQWEPIENIEIDGYLIYRKTSGTRWVRLGITTATTFNDSTAVHGVKYYYTVRPYKYIYEKNYLGQYDHAGIICDCTPPAPIIESQTLNTTSVRLTWNETPGTDTYKVYALDSTTGKWKAIASVKNLEYTATVSCGVTYTYTVRAYKNNNGKTIAGYYDRKGITVQTIPATPVLKEAKPIGINSVSISWNASKGATNYKIYRKALGEKSYSMIAETEKLSYTDTGVVPGQIYTYTVKGYVVTGKQKVYSDYDRQGVSATLIPATPTLKEAKSTGYNSIYISWSAVTGATHYKVYRKGPNESKYSLIATTSQLNYTDTNITCGQTYTYTLKAYAVANSIQILSDYDRKGMSATPIPTTPVLKKLSLNTNQHIVVGWNKVFGANGYFVYRKEPGGNWSRIANVTGGDNISYVDQTANNTKVFYYTVRAYRNTNGKYILSNYNKTGEKNMTETEWREYLVQTAIQYLGIKEYSSEHKEIIALYNSQNPLPRGVKMQLSYEWCAAFGTAIAIKCGLQDIIPGECSCNAQIALLKAIHKWQENDAYVPNTGDYIYYDWNDSGKGDNKGEADHVGIVVSVNNSVIKVIEGNKHETVAYRELKVNGRYIRGYGVPDYAVKATLK